MKKYYNRSLFRFFSSLAVCLPVCAHATTYGGLNYTLDSSSKTATLSAPSSGSYSGAVVIPASITVSGTSYNVVAIDAEAFSGSQVTSVEIGANVNSIGARAFQNCPALNTLTVDTDNKVYFSVDNAVYQDLAIGIGNVADGSEVLAPRRNAAAADDEEETEETADIVLVVGCMGTETIYAKAKTIGEYAFSGCTTERSLFVPSNVTKLYDTSFYGSTGMHILFAKESTPASVTSTSATVSCRFYVYPSDWSTYSAATYWSSFSRIYPLGDADNSQSLTEDDPAAVSSYLLNNISGTFDSFAADANQDNKVSLSDIATIIESL